MEMLGILQAYRPQEMVKMTDGDDEPDIEDAIDTADEFLNFVRRHSDIVGSLLGGRSLDTDTLELSDGEPLRKMFKSDDKIEVVVEVPNFSSGEINIRPNDDGVFIIAGDKEYKAMTPSDVDINEAEVNLNNEVLTVVLPRTDDSGLGSDTEIVDKEITIEDDDNENETEKEDGGDE